MSPRAGITLAEVLVVAGILAILAALAAPVVSSVLELAQRTACQSNLRQLGMAFMTYAQQHDQRLPADSTFGIDDPRRSPAWFHRLPGELDAADVRGPRSVLQCPSYRFAGAEVFANATPKSYKMNTYLDASGRPRHYRLGRFSGESALVLMVDAVAGETGMGQWGHAPYTAVTAERHGCACVLHLDCRTTTHHAAPPGAPQAWRDALTWLPEGRRP